MSVKLIVLKSGEQIISDVKELVDANDNVVSVVFENPYIVRFLTPELLLEGISEENVEVQHKVSFSPWMPLSLDTQIPISPEWILTVVEPIDWVKKSYEQKMNISTEGIISETVNMGEKDMWSNIPKVEDVPNIEIETSQEMVDIWSKSTNNSNEFKNIEVIEEEKDGE